MNRKTFLHFGLLASTALLGLTGCDSKKSAGSAGAAKSGLPSFPATAGKYTVLDIKTDGADQTVAKQNMENVLQKFPDVSAVVGLWSYNAPQCLEALKDAGKLGKVKVFAFDEDANTLAAISAGNCEGTIVQQPYEFGYQSMKYLKEIADGKNVPNKEVPVPATIIDKAGVDAFKKKMDDMKAAAALPSPPPPAGAPKFAFIINNSSDFWSYAKAGLKKAEADFGVIADFQTPADGTSGEQNRIIESILLKSGEYKGATISPSEPANQTEVLNKLAAAMPLICHDSDAPKSNRRFYLGTNNIEAGRLMGKLIKDKMPQGGKIMIFVGKIDAENARQRAQGVIEALGQ